MKKVALLCLLGLWAPVLMAQPASEPKSEYRATPEKINNLVHTKLDARFDFSKAYLNGKAWLTLQPHFYPTDSLLLDAKGMDIKTVALVKGGKNMPGAVELEKDAPRKSDLMFPLRERGAEMDVDVPQEVGKQRCEGG